MTDLYNHGSRAISKVLIFAPEANRCGDKILDVHAKRDAINVLYWMQKIDEGEWAPKDTMERAIGRLEAFADGKK